MLVIMIDRQEAIWGNWCVMIYEGGPIWWLTSGHSLVDPKGFL